MPTRLPPSAWPEEFAGWFLARPPDTSVRPVLLTRYADVAAAIQATDRWQRGMPDPAPDPGDWHAAFHASWAADGDAHRLLRRSLRRLASGSTPAARAATRALASPLLAQVMAGPAPWNLADVIYPASIRIIIEHTLAAPPLLPAVSQLAAHVRAVNSTSPDTIGRDQEFEELLLAVDREPGDLPDGLARDLVRAYRAGQITRLQLSGQLALVLISHETQATAAASLAGMLLETGGWQRAAQAVSRPAPMRNLIAEGNRRGLVFPVRDLSAPDGGQVRVSFAAANMDPAVFGEDAARFDPRAARPPHLAFGTGARRCQGAAGADQFTQDMLQVLLAGLPSGVRLAGDGTVLRETDGLVWSLADLPVSPH